MESTEKSVRGKWHTVKRDNIRKLRIWKERKGHYLKIIDKNFLKLMKYNSDSRSSLNSIMM